MPQLDYTVVDVFTDTVLAGNPLAVVMNTSALSSERMQAIAREFNLSETTFIERRPKEIEQAEGVRVRIFTTQEELPFAGHPTLGTASVLHRFAPETRQGDCITLGLNVGPIPVRFEERGAGDALYGEMTQRDPEFGAELDPSTVAGIIGLSADDMDQAAAPRVVSTGTAFAIVQLRTLEALARVKVQHEQETEYLRGYGARWFYIVAPVRGEQQSSVQYRARMQFYGGEDPATGSAAGCAISYLVSTGAVASGERIHLRQGVEIGRPSEMFLAAQKNSSGVVDVRVAGSTVLVAKGQLFVP